VFLSAFRHRIHVLEGISNRNIARRVGDPPDIYERLSGYVSPVLPKTRDFPYDCLFKAVDDVVGEFNHVVPANFGCDVAVRARFTFKIAWHLISVLYRRILFRSRAILVSALFNVAVKIYHANEGQIWPFEAAAPPLGGKMCRSQNKSFRR